MTLFISSLWAQRELKPFETEAKLTGSFEAVSNAAGPADAVDEGTEHVAPEVVGVVLALLIDQPEAASDHLLHQRHPCPAQVVLVHHLHPHQLLEGELQVVVYLKQQKKKN